jgi:fermentation-respiration switch protein FrsA (DUF1100 family)
MSVDLAANNFELEIGITQSTFLTAILTIQTVLMSPRPVKFPSNGITLAGNLYLPPASSQNRRKAAIVVSHPFGGVKEQTAGRYAMLLADRGFITLAFDAAYQGESGGEPRYLEDPFQRVEDIKSAVTFLTTLSEVDPERIGALGICASGGYVPFAAQTDRRIKAVATVSAADVGLLFREGLGGGQSRQVLLQQLEQASQERTKEAKGQKPRLEHIVPNNPSDTTKETPDLYREGTDYYRTSRAQHPNSVNWYIFRSVEFCTSYTSFALNDLISPHPILIVAGSKADTLYFSQLSYDKALEPKELFLIDGATHIDLYDKTDPVVPKITAFLDKYLCA